MQARIESYDRLFDMMPKMGSIMEKVGCECAVPEYCLTNYLEPGYKDEDILVEFCESVTEAKKEIDGLYFRTLPEITAACIFHKGSYGTFSESYETVLKYIEENGYEIAGEIRESYIDGVWNKENETEWLSEIQVPVRKKSCNLLTKAEKGGNITKLSLEAGKGDKLKKLEKSRKRVLTKA